jgi:hypothetical protein
MLYEKQTKIIYVYDFLNMWTFLVELAAIEERQIGATYPELLFSHGLMPLGANDPTFEADDDSLFSEFEDELDEDDLDMFEGGDDSFEDFGFEENWN